MQSPAGNRRKASRSQSQYAQRAAQYDLELVPFEPYRAEAIAALALRPGDTVLDVGCGTGLSFAGLEEGVRRRGRIVGVEPCPEMLERARERVASRHWHNVDLLGTTAANAPLQGQADAALFHFTHDVMRDPGAIGNVLGHLKPGARVAAAGLQWAPPWMWATNAFVLAAALYSTTSLEGLMRPWDQLARHLTDVRVQAAGLDGIYIASGRIPR